MGAGAGELEVGGRAHGVGALEVNVAAVEVQACEEVVVVAHQRLRRRELGERLGVGAAAHEQQSELGVDQAEYPVVEAVERQRLPAQVDATAGPALLGGGVGQ